MTEPMPPTVTAVFDKPVYAPGETATLTLTVQAGDPPPESRTISGTVTLDDGTLVTFQATFQRDEGPARVVAAEVADPAGLSWSEPLIVGNAVTLTARV